MVKIITTARAIIINQQNELLLVKNKDSKVWFTPGGWLDGFETLEDTVKREVFEELGVEVNPLFLYKIDYFQLTKEQNTKWNEAINKIEHYFICKITKGEVLHQNGINLHADKDTGNTDFVKFFNKEDLKEEDFSPSWLINVL